MPKTKNKTRAQQKTRRPLTPLPRVDRSVAEGRAAATHHIESDSLAAWCEVRLDIPDDAVGDPDGRVRIQLRPYLCTPRFPGEYIYEQHTWVRASELDGIARNLALCIEEGRRAGLLPPADLDEKARARTRDRLGRRFNEAKAHTNSAA